MEREFPEALERMKERLPPYLIMVLENQYNRLNELDSTDRGYRKTAYQRGEAE